MSELKAYVCGGWCCEKEAYPKDEVDKVIAEKDKEIAELKEQVHDYAQGLYMMQARAEKEARHNKYKRCLDKAKWCKDKIDAIENGYMVSGVESKHGVMTTCPPECNPKFSFYKRWHKIWRELAAEPTWERFLQLIHKETK